MLNIISSAAAGADKDEILQAMSGGDELAVPQEMFVSRSEIVVEHTLSIRVDGVDNDQVLRYKFAYETGVELPLIELFLIENALYDVDGFHRISALDLIAQEKGMSDYSLMARVRTGTWAQAEVFAAEANLHHGVHLKPEDIQEAARRYLRNTTLSYTEIARRLNVHHTTVMRLDRREKIRTTSVELIEYPEGDDEAGEPVVKTIESRPSTVTVTRKGKSYELNKTRIGQTKREPKAGDDPRQVKFWIAKGWTFTYRQNQQAAFNSAMQVATVLVSTQRQLIDELINARYTPELYLKLQQMAVEDDATGVRGQSPALVVDPARARYREWVTQLGSVESLIDQIGTELQHDVTDLSEHLKALRSLLERKLGGP